jgi:hypothetical protein
MKIKAITKKTPNHFMKVQKFTTIPNSQQYSKMEQPFVGDEKQTPLVQRHVPVK